MQTTVKVPCAFSVREENEFYAFQHLMARLNPKLWVSQVGIGLHADHSYTSYWGMVHAEGQKITRAEFEQALRDAGFDFEHSSAQLDYSMLCEPAAA